MSITLFRTGIWIIIATLAAYVIRETYLGEMLVFLNEKLLQDVLLLGVGVIGLGVVAWFAGKLTPHKKAKCSVCRCPIPLGAVYCRPHLHEKLEKARHADVVVRRH